MRGLHRRSALCPEIHSAVSRDLASVATLVMWERDVLSLYPSGISTAASPVAAPLAYSSAASLLLAPLFAGTHRTVTSSPLAGIHEQTSIAATAKRWPGPRASFPARTMAEAESTKTVYRCSFSWRWSRARRAR